MFLEPFSRFFVKTEVGFRPHYGHGAALAIYSEGKKLDVASVLSSAIGTPNGELVVEAKDTIRITRVQTFSDKNVLAVLFRRGDPDASRQIYETPEGRLRESDKKPEEKVAISAHLFIDLHSPKGKPGRHRAALEEVPGLGRTYVQALLSNILRAEEYDYMDRNGELKKTHTLISVDGVPDQKLSNGSDFSISEVTLVRPPNVEGLDEPGVIAQEVKMRLKVETTDQNMMSKIGGIVRWAKSHDWDDVKVRVDLPEDRSRVVSVVRANDAADIVFLRSKLVKTKKPMEQCTDKINEELLDLAKALMDE